MSAVFLTVDPALVQHNGKAVQIVGKSNPSNQWDEEYLPGYRVRVETGEEFDAFRDELVKGDHK